MKGQAYFNDKVSSLLIKSCFGMAIFGGVLSLILMKTGSYHFYSSYLISFIYLLTLSLGALFLILIFHLTRAGWSVVVRRIVEHFMQNIGLLGLLFIPIAFGMEALFEWTHVTLILKDHLIQAKTPYLNVPFFLIRAGLYFGIWIVLSRRFFKWSVQQDESGDPDLTARSQKQSTYGVLLFALTISFASFDWIMSLSPHWYSTIFGLYVFAGSVVCALCATSAMALFFRRYGVLSEIITVEHFHDLGKLIYGFVIFWAYIGFSQYFLIWYANIPEETEWFLLRNVGSWHSLSLLLAVGHFAIPLVLFMSRHMKRNLLFHFVMVKWILLMHFVDVFWMIMPTFRPDGFDLQWLDISVYLTLAGLFFGVMFVRMKKYCLYPIKDPRLEESLNFENY